MKNPIHQWLEGKKKPWNGMMNYKYVREFIDYDELITALPSLLSAMEAEIRVRVMGADNGTSNSRETVDLIDTIITNYFNDIRG